MPYIETIYAKSDFIDVKVFHKETVLLKVNNRIRYAGLEFSTNVFCLRLRAKFMKYKFPREVESDDLNDGSVEVLSTSLKVQRKLQVEPIPYYLIYILNLQLNSNTLNIDDDYWKATEDVEQVELNEQFKLEAVNTWLTKRDGGYEINVYGAGLNI
jgi:hypothetical protein